MLVPEPDQILVRASASSSCNLNCIYCPKSEGMENRVPSGLRGRYLSTEEYCINLEHMARNGLRGISFTGGEPTLNPDLPVLVAKAAELFDRVELTSNGKFLPEMLPSLAPNLDVLKVSIDTVNSKIAYAITNGVMEDVDRAVTSVRLGCEAGLQVGVNVVVLRSTVDLIDGIIDFCGTVNAHGFSGNAYVSLLDFYYSEEKKDLWEQEFLPLVELEERFTSRYGPSVVQERFGCRFLWFNADGVHVRFKDSYTLTHRAKKCRECKQYCQEGIYSIMHSIEGWVTTCPSKDPTLGFYLSPDLSIVNADCRLTPLIEEIRQASPEINSFNTMLRIHEIRPVSLVSFSERKNQNGR